MKKYKIEANAREVAQPAKHLRAEGLIPAVIYGEGTDTVHLQMDYQDFRRTYMAAGGSSIIDLTLDSKPYKVLVHHIDFDPVTDKIIHVDFINVRMDKEITAKIPLEFVGEAPAVQDLGGTLVHSREEVEVRCLPDKLVHNFDVDLSLLKDFNAVINIGDLDIPEGIEVLDDPELTVASVSAPREEEEEEVPAEGEEGEEGEEGAEGEEGKEESGEKEEGGGEEKKDE